MSNIENDAKWNVLQVKLQGMNACKAFDFFRDGGFEPILIKGYAAAILYPSDVGRSSVDIDLCFDPIQFENAKSFYEKNPNTGVNVDFHKGFRHLDALSWEELFARSQLIEFEGKPIRVLCPEDHFRVLAVHWLTDGGENKGRLRDIYYGVVNRPTDFDWDKCLHVVSERRRQWIVYTVGLAHYFLDLDLRGLPFEQQAKELPKWLIREVKRQWDLDIPIVPLSATLHDRGKFWKQLKKRIPPNPIHATIAMEGSLDAKLRFHYQIGNFFQRVTPVWKDLARTMYNQIVGNK